MLEEQGYQCAAPLCDTDILRSYHIDHKLPVTRGGTHWPDNIQLLCQFCNQSKGNKTMDEWGGQTPGNSPVPTSV